MLKSLKCKKGLLQNAKGLVCGLVSGIVSGLYAGCLPLHFYIRVTSNFEKVWLLYFTSLKWIQTRKGWEVLFKSNYWQRTHKYGIRIPKSVKETIEIDEENGNTQWRDEKKKIKKKKNNKVASVTLVLAGCRATRSKVSRSIDYYKEIARIAIHTEEINLQNSDRYKRQEIARIAICYWK